MLGFLAGRLFTYFRILCTIQQWHFFVVVVVSVASATTQEWKFRGTFLLPALRQGTAPGNPPPHLPVRVMVKVSAARLWMINPADETFELNDGAGMQKNSEIKEDV